MVGSSKAMQQVYKRSGSWPATISRPHHGRERDGKGTRRTGHPPALESPEHSLVAINAAAIPETLLESELFGHEKGAFTGAAGRRLGKFEECDGGTFSSTRSATCRWRSQAKILRVLQEQAFERVGSNQTVHTNVRIIAATNRDLAAWSAQGNFRPDLYYRLSVFPIRLPPLRERSEDLPSLVQHYLRRFSLELGRGVHDIAPDALDRLRSHSWPGNIRELQSVLKQALLQSTVPFCCEDRCRSLSTAPPKRRRSRRLRLLGWTNSFAAVLRPDAKRPLCRNTSTARPVALDSSTDIFPRKYSSGGETLGNRPPNPATQTSRGRPSSQQIHQQTRQRLVRWRNEPTSPRFSRAPTGRIGKLLIF